MRVGVVRRRRQCVVQSSQDAHTPTSEETALDELDRVGQQVIGVFSRRTLSDITMVLRIVALVTISVIALLAYAFLFFLSFTSLSTRLFAFSVGHFLLSPLVLYTTLRFGYVLNFAFAFAVLQGAADLAQFVIRVIVARAILLDFVFIFVNILFLVADILYIAYLYRLRVESIRLAAELAAIAGDMNVLDALERARGGTGGVLDVNQLRPLLNTPLASTISDTQLRALYAQENNTLRVAALFGIFGSIILLLAVLLFIAFGTMTTRIALLQVGHIPLGIVTLLIIDRSREVYPMIILLALIQTGLDLASLVLRAFVNTAANDPTFISLTTIFNIFFFIVTITFLLVDAAYIVAAVGVLTLPVRGLPKSNSNSRTQASGEKPKAAFASAKMRASIIVK